MLYHEGRQAMDVFPSIPHVFIVFGQGLTSMGPNQYTRILFIQASKYSSCGTRFGDTSNIPKSSLGWCMLMHEGPHDIDVLPPISRVLFMHVNVPTSMGHNQYTGIMFIQASEHLSCGNNFVRNIKSLGHPQGDGYC